MILQNLNNDFFHVLDYGIMVNDYGISSDYSNLRILIYHLNWRRPGGRGEGLIYLFSTWVRITDRNLEFKKTTCFMHSFRYIHLDRSM